MTEYKPVTPQQQPKFAGIKTYMRLPHLKAVRGIDFAVTGIPWDGGNVLQNRSEIGSRCHPQGFSDLKDPITLSRVSEYLSIAPGSITEIYRWFPAILRTPTTKLKPRAGPPG